MAMTVLLSGLVQASAGDVTLTRVIGTAQGVGVARTLDGLLVTGKEDRDAKTNTSSVSVSAGTFFTGKSEQNRFVARGVGSAVGALGGAPSDVRSFTIVANGSAAVALSGPPEIFNEYAASGDGSISASFLVHQPVLAQVTVTGDGAGGVGFSGARSVSTGLTPRSTFWQARLDPPNGGSGTLTFTYGAGGSVTLGGATSPAGGSEASGSATITFSPLPTVNLRAIEVTQTVQDWNQSVPLLAGKQTYVRVFLEQTAASGRLFQFIDGQIRVKRANGSTALLLSPMLTLSGVDAVDTRNHQTRSESYRSLNFLIPAGQLPEGSLTFSFEPSDVGLVCNNSGATEGCELAVNVRAAPRLAIKFLRLGDDTDANFFRPSPGAVGLNAATVEALFPAARLDFEVANFDARLSELDNLNGLVARIARQHREDADPRFACSYGLFADFPATSGGTPVGGEADDIPGSGAAGVSGVPFVTVHELGHVLGRHHAVNHSLGQDTRGFWRGYCDEFANTNAPTFPYFYRASNGRNVPGLGPTTQGFDSFIYGVSAVDSTESSIGIASPLASADIMSYCFDFSWFPSKDFYTNVLTRLDTLNLPSFAPDSFAAAGMATRAAGPLLGVHGRIDLPTDEVTWLPFREVTRVLDGGSADVEGEFLLRATSTTGALLAEIPFRPRVAADGTPDLAFFSLYLPNDPGLARVSILRQGQLLAEQIASVNAPVVQLLAPNGGENLAANPVQVTWAANDPDNDPLFFTVAFSRDDGQTWETLAMDITGHTLTVPPDSLRGTVAGRFRVSVSDGFLSAKDISDGPFQVDNRSPWLLMTMPNEGARYAIGQTIPFTALTYDPEQGSAALSNVVWTSSLDGPLGTGRAISEMASQLTPGIHTITARVTDAQGAQATASRQIEILATPPPRLLDLSLPSPGVAEFDVFAWPSTQVVIEQSSDLVHWSEATRRAQSRVMESLQLPVSANTLFLRARTEPLPPAPLQFTEPPQSTAAIAGSPALLSAGVDGGSPYSVQWFFNDTAITGATNLLLLIGNVTATNAGTYHVVVSNASGGITSSDVNLEVLASAFAPLHAFTNIADGINPWGPLIIGQDGWIYGCARNGGTTNAGVIFKLNPADGTYTVLRRLNAAADGSGPSGGLLQLANGDLFGTTVGGGSFNAGTIFKLRPDGSEFTVLRHFQASGDCRNPQAPLMQASNGRIYGTAYNGGGFGYGGIFSVNSDGADYAILTGFNLTNFPAFIPKQPLAGLIEGPDGALYGCTELGGTAGKGAVFRVTTNGVLTVIKSLGLVAGGAENPNASLLLGADGRLYGTALAGTAGFGCVFTMDLDGGNFDTIRNLGLAPKDAREPRTSLIQSPSGALLGTSRVGGTANQGTVFQLNPNGSGYATLHEFSSVPGNGARSRSPLVSGGNGGVYYGATFGGGPSDQGVIFRLFVSDLGF